jgi:hypothetical protein
MPAVYKTCLLPVSNSKGLRGISSIDVDVKICVAILALSGLAAILCETLSGAPDIVSGCHAVEKYSLAQE